MNHVELVRAYMCKHCLTVDMFTGLASVIYVVYKSQLLAQGPPAENVRQHRQTALGLEVEDTHRRVELSASYSGK